MFLFLLEKILQTFFFSSLLSTPALMQRERNEPKGTENTVSDRKYLDDVHSRLLQSYPTKFLVLLIFIAFDQNIHM